MATWTFGFQIPAGQPAQMVGTYPTLADLQTAIPTGQHGNMAMVSTVLYYWDGSAWTLGADLIGATGSTGTAGTAGAPATFIGSYATLGDLQSAYPTGQSNYMALVGTSLYFWDGSQWALGADIGTAVLNAITPATTTTTVSPSTPANVTITVT